MPFEPASDVLSPYTVLDLTRVRSGPTCVRQLADWGADVIKIEDPESEKVALGGPRSGSDFQNLHRNKRSITLNLKSKQGTEIFRRLAARLQVSLHSGHRGRSLGVDWTGALSGASVAGVGTMRASVLAGVLVAAALLPAGAEAAPACGDSLNQDVKLHDDLDCSAYAADALEIVHNGVTVDLNGHKLIGPPSDHYGVDASAGYDNLVIKDGTIEGFYHSVELVDNEDVTLSKLKIRLGGSNDDYGVYAGGQRHLRMSHLTIDNANYGLYVYDSKDYSLRHSKVTGNDVANTYGVYLGSNDQNHTGVVDDVQVNGAYYGFYIYGETSGFKVTDSTASHGGYAGFYLANDYPTREYTFSDNTANDNTEYGFYAGKRVSGHGNRAKDNGTENCLKVNCS